jgi:hypothetical protein
MSESNEPASSGRIIHGPNRASAENLCNYMAYRRRRKHGLRGLRDRTLVWLHSVRAKLMREEND